MNLFLISPDMLIYSCKYLNGFFGVLGRELWLPTLAFALVAHTKQKMMGSVQRVLKIHHL